MALTEGAQEAELAQRLRGVQRRVAAACMAVGRDPGEVKLVAVSKFHPAHAIRAAYALGQRDFGENYVQELVQKKQELIDLPDLRMRFIGHLQRNKVRQVVGRVCAVDTVDSLALGEALSRRATQVGALQEVLVQVNVAGETQKAGVSVEGLPALLFQLAALPAIRISGLMTIPPASPSPEDSRRHFRALAQLARRHGLSHCSMGMSADLEVAIAEGATIVRVGTAIFGPRIVRSSGARG